MKHITVITTPPVYSGARSVPDGAICGNGDLGTVLGNYPGGLRIYLSKCDLWDAVEHSSDGGLRPLGCIDIPVPAELYSSYHVEQDMDKGELKCRFEDGGDLLTVDIRVCRTENSVLIETGGNIPAVPVPGFFDGQDHGEKGVIEKDGIKGIFRSFTGEKRKYDTVVYAFIKQITSDKYYLFAATNHDVPSPEEYAFGKVLKADEKSFDELKAAHGRAWEEFWEKSSFSCSDSFLETGWYASQYLIACCTGNKHFPPGLYGNFITVENPSWKSDYHLNYNYQAPFYAACSSNHVEMTDCYHAPLEDFFERGKEFAAKWGGKGIMYPVGISPKGMLTEYDPDNKYCFERLFLGQKSNAIHPADIMVFRWNATKDTEYARLHAYPYIKACLEYFESRMTFENGRYSVTQDAAHEVPYYRKDFSPKKYRKYINDKNNCLTLGLLRMCIPAAVEMSEALGIDADKRGKWTDILSKLSPFPTTIRRGRRVFRYTEKGQRWNDGNDVGLQHIYPCGCVGVLKSDKKLIKTAKNSFKQKKKGCYTDDNAVCSFYPMAARLHEDPDEIIKELKAMTAEYRLPNMLYDFGGGCLETCPVYAATLNEMVLQSFEGIMELFPCVPKNTDISFRDLRADGAFLVSSAIKNGKIREAEIFSEAGGTLKLKNPAEKAEYVSGGTPVVTGDAVITINTHPGDRIRIIFKEI